MLASLTSIPYWSACSSASISFLVLLRLSCLGSSGWWSERLVSSSHAQGRWSLWLLDCIWLRPTVSGIWWEYGRYLSLIFFLTLFLLPSLLVIMPSNKQINKACNIRRKTSSFQRLERGGKATWGSIPQGLDIRSIPRTAGRQPGIGQGVLRVHFPNGVISMDGRKISPRAFSVPLWQDKSRHEQAVLGSSYGAAYRKRQESFSKFVWTNWSLGCSFQPNIRPI